MDTIISWGIIGCGNVTEVKSGPAFNQVPDSKLHAVMRRDAALAEDYAKRHGVPQWYADANDLLKDDQVNAIYIATPPLQHEVYAIAAMELGKPVYVEKPVALNTAACKRMLDAIKANDGRLVVAHYRRALPMFRKIKELVLEGAIGKLKIIRLTMFQPRDPQLIAASATNWRVNPELSGGGYFFDLAPHQLDIIQYIFGNPQSFQGFAAHQTNDYVAEDAVVGVMELPGGVLFQGNWNFSMPDILKEDSCVMIGELGYLQFPFFGNEVRLVTEAGVRHLEFIHPRHIQQPMIGEVVQHFLGRAENPCTLEEAMVTMDVMETFVYGKH